MLKRDARRRSDWPLCRYRPNSWRQQKPPALAVVGNAAGSDGLSLLAGRGGGASQAIRLAESSKRVAAMLHDRLMRRGRQRGRGHLKSRFLAIAVRAGKSADIAQGKPKRRENSFIFSSYRKTAASPGNPIM